MANENSPIYDELVAESGNPVPPVPVDRSYRAIVAMAAEGQRPEPARPMAAVSARASVAGHRAAG